VTVDSLSADTPFTSRGPRTAHFGAASSHGCGPPDSLTEAGYRRRL